MERPSIPNRAPSWDLAKVLEYIRRPPFEPLRNATFRDLTKKVLFLIALATARRVGELQAVSETVSFRGSDAFLSFLPEFQAKTEREDNPLPRSFMIKALNEFVENLTEELVLCPVRALKIYLDRTKDIVHRPRSLFVSPKASSRPLSKNALVFCFLFVCFSEGSHIFGSGFGGGPWPLGSSLCS